MATTSETDNMGQATVSDKKKVIGGLADADQRELIDRAVLVLRRDKPSLKRGHFVVEAAVEKARAVLKIQRAGDVAA
jgi:uncharacterized protein (DUF1778 family)